jgi:WD40 repeat protein
MFAVRIILLIPAAILLGGCAITTQTQINSGHVVMDLNKEAPSVITVDFSPDGKNLVPAGLDGTTRVWDLTGAREAMKFKEVSGLIKDVTYLPDGKTIAVATDNGATFWNGATGTEIRRLTGNFGGKLSFSPDGKYVFGGHGLNSGLKMKK